MARPSYRYSIYGLTLASDRPLTTPVPPARCGASVELTHGPEPPPGDWEASETLYESAFRVESGCPVVRLSRAPAGYQLHFPRAATFYLMPARIHCLPLPGGDATLTEIYLLGTVLSWYRECQGVPMLHAAAVALAGGAAAFLASNRGGKSSLAASLVQSGADLLTDDLLAVQHSDAAWLGYPGYPQLRMWPEQAQQFLDDPAGLTEIHSSGPKLAVPLHRLRDSSFRSEAAPLRVVYLPERRLDATADRAVRITPTAAGMRLIELARHSFLARMVEAAGLQPRRLPHLAQLATAVAVRTLSYPSGVEHLPAVAEAIRADLTALNSA